MSKKTALWRDYPTNLALNGLLRGAMLLPYENRVRFFGWLVAKVIGPLAGYRRRIRENLAYVCPELDARAVARLCDEVCDNAGRTMIEIYSGPEFTHRVATAALQGPGVETLEKARKAGTPVIVVTGHFGNYDASRAALHAHGFRIGALYRPMNNRYFNAHYVKAISSIATPVFPRGRHGYAELLRFVKNGGMAGFLIDQYMANGADLTFFGKTAPTALSAAELALRYNAPLVATYGIRRPDGLDFDIVIEAPIPHSDAFKMTQALNDSLERITRRNMGQWFWIHRRWKPHRQCARAAASIGP